MSKLDSWVDNKITQNLFIWVILFFVLLTTVQVESNPFLASLFIILLFAPASYINNLLILPFTRKNRLLFISLFILNILVFTVISVYLIAFFDNKDFELSIFYNFLGVMVLAMIFASSIKIARDSLARRQQIKDAELKLLKAQLNPHFLFNTLNNLYGLSVLKSDKLPDLMLKLSDLLRYSLYETKETTVPLEKEIQYLENYISLEKIRLENTTIIEFNKTGDLSSKNIAPMLLIVFVENAFKHLSNLEDKKNKVTISIIKENDTLTFNCKNTTDSSDISEQNIEKGKSGIGLENARKRLALMYPEKYLLHVTKKNKTYNVELTLNL